MSKINEEGIKVRRSSEFRLKAKMNRNLQVIRIKDFGFIPDTLIFERVIGKNNIFAISAVLTEEELSKKNDNNKNTIKA